MTTVKELDLLLDVQEDIDEEGIRICYNRNENTEEEVQLTRTFSDMGSEVQKRKHARQSIVVDIEQMNLQKKKKMSEEERRELTQALFGESSEE